MRRGGIPYEYCVAKGVDLWTYCPAVLLLRMGLKRPAAAVKVEADDGRRGRGTGAARDPVDAGALPWLEAGSGILLPPLGAGEDEDEATEPWSGWAHVLAQQNMGQVSRYGE